VPQDTQAPPQRRDAAATTWHGLFAVLFTYNRKDLAAQCLASVLEQDLAPERIVLVDNGCTDGTREALAARGLLADPRIDYLRLERNLGASGGLRAGLERAFRCGCDWAWTMDDDVICEPGTLAGLKAALDANFAGPEAVGFLVSRLVDGAGRENNVPQIDDRRDAATQCLDWPRLLEHGLVKVRIATLTSMVLPRQTLIHCGLPRRDFFIWGEDTEYTLRVTGWRPGYLVGGSRAVHLRREAGELEILRETDSARLDNYYYLYRNTTYLRRTFWPLHGLLLFLGKAAVHFLRALHHPKHPLRCAWIVLSGTCAGLLFRPRPEPLGEGSDEDEPAAGRTLLPAAGRRAAEAGTAAAVDIVVEDR
jgi:dTDP-4-dehydrorhamnose reductase